MEQLAGLPRRLGPENSRWNFMERNWLLVEGWGGHWAGCNEHRGLCPHRGGGPGDLL